MAKEVIVGLDIGTSKICAVVGEVMTDGQVHIIGAASRPSSGVRKGVIVDLEAVCMGIASVIAELSHETGYDIHNVVVGVTGQHIASLNSRGVVAITNPDREVTVADVNRAIEQSRVIVLPPDREIVHAIPRAYYIDGQEGIRNPVGMSATRLEVESHVVTGGVTFLQNVTKTVHMAGLSLEGSVLEPIASAEAILTSGERERGVAIADIGGGTTDFAVFIDGDVVSSGVIPVGGSHVSKDISVGLRCSEEEAERVKLSYGAARLSDVGPEDSDLFEIHTLASEEQRIFSRRVLVEIINPRIEELFEILRRELEKSGYHNLLPAGLVISGGGAKMTGVRELCEKITGLPTRVGVPIDIIGRADLVNSPLYATGVGLVLVWAHHPGINRKQLTSKQGGVAAPTTSGGFVRSFQQFFDRLFGRA